MVEKSPAPPGGAGYRGQDRREIGPDPTALLSHMLDEIDYGLLLITAQNRVCYFNHAARLELDGLHPLQLQGTSIGTHRADDFTPLFDALAAAQRGLRQLLTLGSGEQRVSLSVVPLPTPAPDAGFITLLMLGKRQVCAQLSVQGYARCQNLTPAETRVLELLCMGRRPSDIALTCQVQVSTVRTQIGSIRAKTGAASIRELVRQVAVLPPLVGALRRGMGGAALADALAWNAKLPPAD